MDLSRIPTVMTADEILDKAFQRANRKSGAGKSRLERVRDGEIRKAQTVQNIVNDKLEGYVRKFPSFDRLDPFYRDLAHILIDLDRTKKALGAINWARGQVKNICESAAKRMKRAEDTDDIVRERRRVYGRVASVLEQVADDLNALNRARDNLKSLPDIHLDQPTLVVAGYPNVGKSEFIRAVSNARPEVAAYPFTTKGVSIGHVERDRHTYQVVDTPGLLDRPLSERNDIERQAVLALEHLGDAILFMLDPSQRCGYPMEAQLNLLEETRESFPSVPILEVENKADLLVTESDRLKMSAKTGEGVDAALEEALTRVHDAWRGQVVQEGQPAAAADEGDVAWEHPGQKGVE